MINFFRRIRKKMADDNKPLKYLKYAIGEIVLVVIGILIALSINNWNETRLQNDQLLKALGTLVKAGHFPWLEQPDAFFTALKESLTD